MGLRSALKRASRLDGYSRDASEAADLQDDVEASGATPIDCCDCGKIVKACGVIRSVAVRPVAGVPAVEADIYDGTGHVRVVWLGRRHIGGIEVGRSLSISGRLTADREQPTVFNPRYELRPRGLR